MALFEAGSCFLSASIGFSPICSPFTLITVSSISPFLNFPVSLSSAWVVLWLFRISKSTITSAFGSAKNSCLLTCWEFRHSLDDVLTLFPSELADDEPQVCFGSTHFSRQEFSCLSFGLIRSCYPVALAIYVVHELGEIPANLRHQIDVGFLVGGYCLIAMNFW